ncbi:hypothetical protein QF038_001852 [Pseudarthrobacter sp. W1I19]|uniref:hypothetical protein n=1 Tax=Pseudarthrobacter sp. W1I19 TaxID=3042288 RepID=UPI002782E829|nr:hypothetical protein [Pseudarthrobacter sp. W1I19]MDQ0923344.1 hypothetical protein [Pseudarthrobacter sp. W1I19]
MALSDQGYAAFKKQTAAATAVVPDTFVPLYDETLTTNLNLDDDTPIVGSKFARLQSLQGQRDHGGDLTVMAEPNTTAQLLDMLLTRGSVTGSNPYTWPFTLGFTDPNSYTLDISNGVTVSRYWGVQASKISPVFAKNEMQHKVSVSALGSFLGREIASISTITLTLKTDYDPTPTAGLVVGDLVAIWKASDGTLTSFTISSLTATTVVLNSTAAAFAAGDMLVLRPATASLPALYATPFSWARTQFCFGATAAAALSATHTALEQGSTWTVLHDFKDDKGEKRSGGLDPVALLRKRGDLDIKLTKIFSGPDEAKNFTGIKKVALVIRCYAAASNGTTYELRITMNNLKLIKGGDKPKLKVGEWEYYELEYHPDYDTSDASAWDLKVINAIAAT